MFQCLRTSWRHDVMEKKRNCSGILFNKYIEIYRYFKYAISERATQTGRNYMWKFNITNNINWLLTQELSFSLVCRRT